MATKTRGLVQRKQCLLSRFRGAMVGAVVGDCLGAHFENSWNIDVQHVVDFFARLPSVSLKTHGSDSESETEADAKAGKSPTAGQEEEGKTNKEARTEPGKKHLHVFTDDTAMARSVASSLIKQKKVDARDVAERFAKEYEREPWRGYGGSVGTVFKQLKATNYKDPHGPASLQFDGAGSFGNGGAMRIVPVALFGYHMDEEQLNSVVSEITRITHSHRDALNGAKLQAAAVHEALRQEGGPLPDTTAHLNRLQTLANSLESVPAVERVGSPLPKRRAKRKSEGGDKPYCEKLQLIQKYIDSETEIDRSELEDTLGNDVSALGSVPAAIYSFLRATRTISDVPVDSAFERTIIYAITLGGDTDTIATMAGAMAGAYYGVDAIPALWKNTCEGVEEAISTATQLHRMVIMENDKEEEADEKKSNSSSENSEKGLNGGAEEPKSKI